MKNAEKVNKQIIIFAGVLIHEGKILLNLRSEPELPDAHLKWELPGGKAEFGETPEEALIREFKEETGRKIRVKSLLPKVFVNYWEYPWGTQQTFCLIYLCELINDGVAPKDHHVEKCEWVSIADVKQENSLPGMIEILEMAKNMYAIPPKTGI